jgi:hypothetical protein
MEAHGGVDLGLNGRPPFLFSMWADLQLVARRGGRSAPMQSTHACRKLTLRTRNTAKEETMQR